MVVDRNILCNQITLFAYFTLIPKAGIGLTETGDNFYSVGPEYRFILKVTQNHKPYAVVFHNFPPQA